jgi:hypothetical protein
LQTGPLRSRRSWEGFRLTSNMNPVSCWRKATTFPFTAVISDGDLNRWWPDIFRVAHGKIAEHWDVMQEEVPAAQSANGNSMLTAPRA